MLLTEAAEAYIARKQLMGRKYITDGKELRAFARFYPTLRLSDLRARHVQTFLNYKPLSQDTWIGRYKRLRTFSAYWVSRRELTAFQMPVCRRAQRRSFHAYIFTPLQMRNILTRASEIQSHKLSELSPAMFRMLMVFLYATGCWISEALTLKWADIDFDKETITVNARVGASREIPIGADLKRMLRHHRDRSRTDLVFATVSGRCVSYSRATVHFRRVRRLLGIRRMDSFRYEPGFNDLRHTFAVERITDWYRRGADVELLLPRLASYMGLFTCTITDRYLPLVPEHFRKQLDQLSNK